MGTLKQASKILSLFEDTPNEQVQAVLESGFLADLRDANVAEISRDSFRRMCGLKSLNLPLLDSVGTVAIAATVEPFIAREKFVVDTNCKAKVKIAWLSDNFKDWFFGKTEAPASEMLLLRYSRLVRWGLDASIMAELGEAKETTLANIYALIERQKNGKSGALLTNGYANIFYVRDTNDAFWAVYVRWGSFRGGWDVYARSVEYPDGWGDGRQVF